MMKIELVCVRFESYDANKKRMGLFFYADLEEIEKMNKLIGKELELIV